MKKLRITFICCCIILLAFQAAACQIGGQSVAHSGWQYGGQSGLGSGAQEYLRIHVRANSNSEKDQAVKYEIRDLIVNCLAKAVSSASTKSEAIAAVKQSESAVNGLIEAHLKSKGFNYGSKILIKNESFPTRVYGDGELVLEAGYYDAVIVELGKAEGENWWCVVYPPLCFTKGENVTYRSKIYELIKGYGKK